MVEIGTDFEDDNGHEWTVGGYVYYEGDLYYSCYDSNGRQEDIYEEAVEDACLHQ